VVATELCITKEDSFLNTEIYFNAIYSGIFATRLDTTYHFVCYFYAILLVFLCCFIAIIPKNKQRNSKGMANQYQGKPKEMAKNNQKNANK